MDREGVEPSNHRLCCRSYHYGAAALPNSQLSGPRRIRDKASNLDLHVQSVASCRLDDPGANRAAKPRETNQVFQASRLPFNPGSPEIDVLRGGALEPEPRARRRNRQAKARAYSLAQFRRPKHKGSFSLRRGLDSELSLVQAEHHLFVCTRSRLRNDEGDPLGRPR
jgi:hypothetical protein